LQRCNAEPIREIDSTLIIKIPNRNYVFVFFGKTEIDSSFRANNIITNI